jgi:YcxB-like protein
MTPLQAEFDQSLEDVKAFYNNALPRSPVARRQKRITQIACPILIVGAGFLLCYLIGYGFPPPPIWLIYIGVIALAVMYLTPSSVHKQQMKQVLRLFQQEDHRQRLGPTKIELRPEGVAAASPIGATVFDWKAISEIVATSDYVFLHLDSLSALMVPRRAFPDDATFDRFVEAARLYHRNAGVASESESEE